MIRAKMEKTKVVRVNIIKCLDTGVLASLLSRYLNKTSKMIGVSQEKRGSRRIPAGQMAYAQTQS